MVPDNKMNLMISYVDDIDGDGLADVVILPAMTITETNLSGTMKFFKGTKRLP
jgi:hypothetical protein